MKQIFVNILIALFVLIIICLLIVIWQEQQHLVKQQVPQKYHISPTPTLAPDRKIVYTTTIKGVKGNGKIEGITISSDDANKIITAPIGAVVALKDMQLRQPKIQVIQSQQIIDNLPAGYQHCLEYACPVFRVVGVGITTLTITEIK